MSGAFILDFLVFALHRGSVQEGGSVGLIRGVVVKKVGLVVDINYSTSPGKVAAQEAL